MLEAFAPAKVNLFLHVVGRRADGYHLLDSLAVFASVGDRLEARPAGAIGLELTAAASGLPDGDGNLVLRAARALAGAAGVSAGAALRLEKVLPVASGLGGGSADAAAALRVLMRLWGVVLPARQLADIALALGADVPVCLDSRPARMGGVGEVLAPAPALPELGLVLVNPGVPVATAAVFAARAGGFSAPAALPAGWTSAAALAGDLARLSNDLEAPAIALAPPIGVVLAALRALPGCLLARMSGSGATCFGLFAGAAMASAAATILARPGWWCWGGGLYAAGAGAL
ncbi:MAG TPA: 4-(cytidine 5'-diphospho)-2-C-methyl-D-erythritol kinase [Acetobacteraceae bacterium]|nr:4-(cytidine 5'-diphospho)-2-C-methyl-D-erythritol kinase [Acetobacteraceae bacterium]